MNDLRVPVFSPALLVQLLVALTIFQPAFSQEIQIAPGPAQNTEASNGKAAVRDEACEQSPTVAPQRTGVAQPGANEAAIFKSQPVRFVSPHEVKIVPAARPLFSGPDTTSSLKALNGSDLSHAEDPADWQQTGAVVVAATYTPLTPSQKMRRAFKAAFLSPQAYLLAGASATLTEAGEDDLPHKETEDRVADGLSRFAIKFGRRSTNNLLGSGVYASLFRQDPRYERAADKGFGARALHAASRVFITRGDNGKLQPNYSRFAGQLSASALSNLWEQSTPGHDRIGTDATFRRFGTSFIGGAVFNVLREFAPEIKKIFGK